MEFKKLPGVFDRFDRQVIVLSRSKEDLEERVELRINQMIADGLVQEVKGLLGEGLLENPSAAGSIGYRETIAFLAGELTKKELVDSIALNTRRLLKKQRTWFKKFLPQEALLDVSNLESLPDHWHRIRAR